MKFFFILPAKIRLSTEITAFLNACHFNGFSALAIALLIKTPSQPISIAIVAFEAVPIPASITGTLDCLIIKEILTLFCKPNPEPIGVA